MLDSQIGHAVVHTDNYKSAPRLWSGPIKFEDSENWNLADSCIARGIVTITSISPRREILLSDLVKKLREATWIDEEYIRQSILRLLRIPPDIPNDMVKGLSFRV